MNILGFSAANIISILQLGISGVAFVFLAMSFILLRKEQDRTPKPRMEMLDSIRFFAKLSLIFALLVASLSIIENIFVSPVALTTPCSDAIERAEVLLSNKDAHTIDTLHSLLQTTISKCK